MHTDLDQARSHHAMLRQLIEGQILSALELYHSRLYSLEMLRRSAARARPVVISAI